MSYILEALKKSEQERGHGSVPGLQTIHSSSLNYHHDKKSIWPLLLITLLFINIAALSYFLITKEQPETVMTTQEQTNNDDVIESSNHFITPDTLQEESVHAVALTNTSQNSTSPQDSDISGEIVIDTPMQETMQIEQTTETINLHDIPLNVRQHIPAMQFSAHIYSTNASQRSIVINGRFMEEGNAVAKDLILNEITRDGAIFDFQGYRFSTSVLSGWDIN